MTHDRVGSFVSDLVEMAKAVEQVPQLQHALDEASNRVVERELRITDLEVSLEASRKYAAGLEQRLHDLEVANSAIELRFLEADDAKDTLVRILDNMGKDILGALQAVTPIPEPTPKANDTATIRMPVTQQHVDIINETLEPRDTFQGVKSDITPADDWFERVIAPLAKFDDGGPYNEYVHGAPIAGNGNGDPSPFVQSPSPATTPSTDASSSDDMAGSVSVDPTATPKSNDSEHGEDNHGNMTSGDGVSVPSDPTQKSSALLGVDDQTATTVNSSVTPPDTASVDKSIYDVMPF